MSGVEDEIGAVNAVGRAGIQFIGAEIGSDPIEFHFEGSEMKTSASELKTSA